MSLSSDLRVALEAADAADAAALPRFRSPLLQVEMKADHTPVSAADRATEQAVRDILSAARPDDAVVGEEYGASGEPANGRRWIVDPIDATVNYVRGVPVWGTLLALEDDRGIAIGVVSAPALGLRWWAGRGLGAWRNAERIAVSKVDRIEEAHLSFNSESAFETRGLGPQVGALTRRCVRTRGFGDFWSFMLVAEGAVDIALESLGKVWDLAPLLVIVEEAGGRFTDLTGARTVAGGDAVASNGLLHDAALAALR